MHTSDSSIGTTGKLSGRTERTSSIVATGFASLCVLACAAAGPQRETSPGRARGAAATLVGAGSLTTYTVTTGVTLVTARDTTGPWAIHVLDIELDRCAPQLDAVKAGPPLNRRATTTELAQGALAAINADFFDAAGTTTGAHVRDGVVLVGPGERPIFAVTSSGLTAGTARISGFAAAGTDTLRITQVNRDVGATGEAAFLTTWWGAFVPAGTRQSPDGRGVVIRTIRGDDAAGSGIVSVITPPGTRPAVRAGSVAVAGTDAWLARRSPGDTVTWSVSLLIDGEKAFAAVGGFPLLLRNGRDVVGEQQGVVASFGDRRHPRTAVGWSDRHLFMVVIDGRQMPWSDGMTLREVARLMLRLGASEAINLDGGGSSTMIVAGRTANRPSDETGERAVGNTLTLVRCGSPPDPT